MKLNKLKKIFLIRCCSRKVVSGVPYPLPSGVDEQMKKFENYFKTNLNNIKIFKWKKKSYIN